MNPEEEGDRGMPAKEDAADPSSADATPSGGVALPAEARLGVTDVQAYIGRQLRAVYDDVVKQPIPDRFLALMKRLEDGPSEP